MKRLHDQEDRISQLPEPILHQIVSFLSNKDATKTSALSKIWNSAWNSFPVLDFTKYYSRNEYQNFDVQDFCNFVDNSIARRPPGISIRKFHLWVCFNVTGPESRLEDLERWLNYAVSNNVEDLKLHSCKDVLQQYLFPTLILFRAYKSLKDLYLSSCKLVESGIRSDIRIRFSLRKVIFHDIDIDDHTLQSLLSNGSSLENLSIRNCSGFQSLNLSSTKIKELHLFLIRRQVQNITIEAPNLQVFTLDFANVLSGRLQASKYSKNLKELQLICVNITDAIFRVIQGFGALEELELINCSLQISSYRLSSLSTSDAIRLKIIELVVYCMGCYSKNIDMRIGIPHGWYKLETNLVSRY